ncbi:MAG: hypothetical protein U5K37_03510 [Natrialbaceae archaeon]|nr:hypothetical protein [Natrialbaceae archaeon]
MATAFDKPTFANMIEGGQTPYLEPQELQAIGFDIVVYPLSALFAATHALQEAYQALAANGSTAAVDTVSFDEFESVIDAPAVRAVEQEYATRFASDDELHQMAIRIARRLSLDWPALIFSYRHHY